MTLRPLFYIGICLFLAFAWGIWTPIFPWMEWLEYGFIAAAGGIVLAWAVRFVSDWYEKRVSRRQFVNDKLFGQSKNETGPQKYFRSTEEMRKRMLRSR